MTDLERRLSAAVREFWLTRRRQEKAQGSRSGRRDQGARSAVTGGAQLDGFVSLVSELLIEGGIPRAAIFRKKSEKLLPGYFRPTKEWDLLVVVDGALLASIEFKAHIGPSFGNNYNNRTEEALGSATDLWTAFREGAFRLSPRPWLGYLMLLEEASQSTSPVAVKEPHFRVFEEYRDASYARRYELFCDRLIRERLYDAACLLLSDRIGGVRGSFTEPVTGLTFRNFVGSLTGHMIGYRRSREGLRGP